MVPRVMVNCFLVVMTVTGLMCIAVYKGYFQKVHVELGLAFYAERIHPALKDYLPSWIKMPLNTAVNIGYVIVGAAWCAYTSVALMQNRIKTEDAKMFYIFNFASCCYGPIQTLRLLTELHGFAVLDQWYTVPFFMWVLLWGLHCRCGWSAWRNLFLTLISVLSYILVLYNDLGFEICLSIHITLAVFGAVLAWSINTQAPCGKYFILAILSCVGFVILKVFDLILVEFSTVFKYVSGHFLSKICDVYQIHYVNRFFQAVTFSAHVDSKKKHE